MPMTNDDEVSGMLLQHRQKRIIKEDDAPSTPRLDEKATGSARFAQAILAARSLHPDLLSQSQKLRLYALFRQSREPAPDEATFTQQNPDANELAQAKWEAWYAVRSLSAADAMDAYSDIIEGLVAMMAEFDDGAPDTASTAAPPPRQPMNGSPPKRRTNTDDEGDAGDEEDEGPPHVEKTSWSTTGMSVAPGATFDVPLLYSAPCRCSYSFSIASGTGPIAFKASGPVPGSAPLLSEYKSDAEGSFEVSLPPSSSGKGGSVLMITLDNTASSFSTVEVKCQVTLEPLAELKLLEQYQARIALRGLIERKRATLEAHTNTYAKVGREVQGLEELASKLREQLSVAESEIKIKYKQLEQGAEMAEIMSQEIQELISQYRQAP